MRVGFVGLGIMGGRMAANLARAGHDVAVFNRTAAKAEAFAAEHRARVALSPADAANGADVLITMLVDGPQVRDALADVPADVLAVDMSTIGAVVAREIAQGRRFMDAPVTGSSPKAQDGTLTIMAGGDAADFALARPLFETMGSLVLHVGPVGHGQAIKLINNAVAAVNTSVVAQALLAGEAAGLDLDALVAVMGAGSGGSTMLDLKASPMRERAYETLFKLEHMLKDVRLCLAETPFAAAGDVERVLAAADAAGLGERDFAALREAIYHLRRP